MSACSTPQTTSKGSKVTTLSSANVKTVDGKRSVWIPGEGGSQIPGHWVPEDSAEAYQKASQVQRVPNGTLRGWQDASGQGTIPENDSYCLAFVPKTICIRL